MWEPTSGGDRGLFDEVGAIIPCRPPTALGGWQAFLARSGVPIAAILMPAGFFLSSARRDRTSPNALVVLVYAGAASLAAGVVALGVGLLARTSP